MKKESHRSHVRTALYATIALIFFSFSGYLGNVGYHDTAAFAGGSAESIVSQSTAPVPLLEKGHPVDWWFVFKFNAASFPGCHDNAPRDCLFGGTEQDYQGHYSEDFVYASSENPSMQRGDGCLGDTLRDPVGATFDQVYNNGSYSYVIWNDQFYGDPVIKGCTKSCSSPWGHSKGMLAWNEDGTGFVMQVSTPSWPASGSKDHPRTSDGNTLGCIDDNDVKVSQHFFALKLTQADLIKVLHALQNASVVTDPANLQIVHNGGPAEVQQLVKNLGKKSESTSYTDEKLSTGVDLISKPSKLQVPPWQLVSAALNGLPIRAATWWATPEIYTTTASSTITCWNEDLGTPGPVQIATTGGWSGSTFSLKGGPQLDSNHAKIGVSTDQSQPYAIFGDLNQQGTLTGQKCSSSQNGRGGTFYIIKNKALYTGLMDLIRGETADVASDK
ncbi:MAG: deoxyribonuclease II family protein [Thermodesulfovibrionales bacterium]